MGRDTAAIRIHDLCPDHGSRAISLMGQQNGVSRSWLEFVVCELLVQR
jgi:hypothetical protein